MLRRQPPPEKAQPNDRAQLSLFLSCLVSLPLSRALLLPSTEAVNGSAGSGGSVRQEMDPPFSLLIVTYFLATCGFCVFWAGEAIGLGWRLEGGRCRSRVMVFGLDEARWFLGWRISGELRKEGRKAGGRGSPLACAGRWWLMLDQCLV